MNTDDVYMAGFFDGEGCVAISKRWHLVRGKKYLEYAVRLSLGQNDGGIMDWIIENYGGQLYPVKRDGSFMWIATNRAALKVLERITPHLKYKKLQAELALTFYKGLSQGRRQATESEIERREDIFLRLKALKKTFIASTHCMSKNANND